MFHIGTTEFVYYQPGQTQNLVRAKIEFSPNPCVGPYFGSGALCGSSGPLNNAPIPKLTNAGIWKKKIDFR